MEYKVSGRKLLIVEDDEGLKGEMVSYFSVENTVFAASDVDEAVNILKSEGNFDAVILDIILKKSIQILSKRHKITA